ncbi:hypothetical protein IT409_02935, partial [Candidatus Falkowbacteria bacterium]|nr:hypothetical protein [Candidatus Falkowbacteria bacterium]
MEDIVMGVINAISQETGAAKWFVAVCLTIVVGIVLAVGFRAAFVYEVEFAQIGFIYNRVNGKIEKVPHPGYRIVYPFIEEGNTIDARPFQVCINANNRVLNCKLVQFDPKGLDVFLSLHGRDFQNNLTDIL